MYSPDHFQHQSVRDLVWLLTTPELCHCTAELWQIPNPDWATLVQLDRAPQPLEDWLSESNSQLLGHYHEQLWLFYFHQHPQVELLACNRIIRSGGRTLGELDLLLRDHRDGLIWHLELAIKFYLGHHFGPGAADQWNRWLGVACRDSMEHKWQRLTQHQLTLSQHPEVRRQLESSRMVPDRASALTRGYLFYPTGDSLPAPAHMNPEHLRGRWLTLSDWLAQYQPMQQPEWRICDKPHWLARPTSPQWPRAEALSAELTAKLTADRLQQGHTGSIRKQKPVNGSEGVLLEHLSGERLFLVADGWPGYLPLPWQYLQK